MSIAPISSDTVLTVTPSLHERRVGGKVFVLDRESVMHAFDNAVAVAIWDALRATSTDGMTVETLVNAIVSAFEVERPQASDDVLEFARVLHARGIVCVV